MLRKSCSLLIVALAITACELNLLASEELPPGQAAKHGLLTKLIVDRADVAPGAAFTATYTITNNRAEAVRLESSCVALARGVVYRNGQKAGFAGTGSGCLPGTAIHEIAAGATIERKWQVEATIVLRVNEDGRRDVAGAEPGEYVYRVMPDVVRLNGAKARLPQIEQRIRVR
jgi:hypothetical protein